MSRRHKKEAAEPAIKPDREPRIRVLRMDEPSDPELPVDDSGLSLEDLGQAYAAVLNRGGIPYEEPAEQPGQSASEVNDELQAALD